MQGPLDSVGFWAASSVQFLLPQYSDLHVPVTLSFANSSSCFLSSAGPRGHISVSVQKQRWASVSSHFLYFASLWYHSPYCFPMPKKAPVSNIVQSFCYLWLCQFRVFNHGWKKRCMFLLVSRLSHWTWRTNNLQTWMHEPFSDSMSWIFLLLFSKMYTPNNIPY